MRPTIETSCAIETAWRKRPVCLCESNETGSLAFGKRVACLAAFLIALCSWPGAGASAATYYVDFVQGANSSSGTDADSPWKHCPGDPNATGSPASVTLVPGDRIKFKGGVIYFGAIEISRSGTSAAPIVYDGNHAGDWGTGRAVMDLQHVAGTIITGERNVSYISIRGFELRNAGGYADDDPILLTTCDEAPVSTTPGGTGISFYDGGNESIVMENLYLHRLGNWRNTQPFDGVNSVTGTGIALQNCDGVVIRDCDITKMRVGISVKATTVINNVLIDACDIHDYIVWCVDVAPRRAGATLSNIRIARTRFHDYHQHDSGNWAGCGEKPHTDGIFLRTAGMSSTWTNVTVDSCDFYADYPGNSMGGTASIYVSQGPSVNIYNNTFKSDAHTRSIGLGYSTPGDAVQVIRIYNNTFFNSATPVFLAGETNSAKRKVYIQNNVFWRGGQANRVMINHDSGVSPSVLDNNIYWDPVFSASAKYVFFQSGYRRFADLRSMGYEANGLFVDPGFTYTDASIPSINDLHILATGGAVGRGANLSAYFTTDKDGKPRSALGGWDIGAYASGAARRVESPSNLRRVGNP